MLNVVDNRCQDAVSELIPTLKRGFSIVDVEMGFVRLGKKFVRTSIRGALIRMERQGKIRVLLKGEGRRPTTYYVPEDATASIFQEP